MFLVLNKVPKKVTGTKISQWKTVKVGRCCSIDPPHSKHEKSIMFITWMISSLCCVDLWVHAILNNKQLGWTLLSSKNILRLQWLLRWVVLWPWPGLWFDVFWERDLGCSVTLKPSCSVWTRWTRRRKRTIPPHQWLTQVGLRELSSHRSNITQASRPRHPEASWHKPNPHPGLLLDAPLRLGPTVRWSSKSRMLAKWIHVLLWDHVLTEEQTKTTNPQKGFWEVLRIQISSRQMRSLRESLPVWRWSLWIQRGSWTRILWRRWRFSPVASGPIRSGLTGGRTGSQLLWPLPLLAAASLTARVGLHLPPTWPLSQVGNNSLNSSGFLSFNLVDPGLSVELLRLAG